MEDRASVRPPQVPRPSALVAKKGITNSSCLKSRYSELDLNNGGSVTHTTSCGLSVLVFHILPIFRGKLGGVGEPVQRTETCCSYRSAPAALLVNSSPSRM